MASARIIELTSQGEVRFLEALANGQSYAAIKAPASLAATYSITLPTALPGAGTRIVLISSAGVISLLADGSAAQFLTTDGAGAYSWASASGTLQAAYNGGATIAVDGTNKIDISQSHNIATLKLNKTGTGAGRHVEILNAGTGEALYISQSGDSYALFVTRNISASVGTVKFVSGASNDRPLLELASNGTGQLCRGISLVQAGAAIGCYIQEDGAREALYISATANFQAVYIEKTDFGSATAVNIQNSGTGDGLLINQGAQAGRALHVTSNQAFNVVLIEKTNAGIGSAVLITNAGTASSIGITQSGEATAIDINKTATGVESAMVIADAGTGSGLRITKSGNGSGVTIEKNATGGGIALSVLNVGTGEGCLIDGQGTGSTYQLSVTQSAGSNSTGVTKFDNGVNLGTATMSIITQRHGSHSGAVLGIQNAGSGNYIATDAGGTYGTTGAKLNNAGAWLIGTCFRDKKQDFEALDPVDSFNKLMKFSIQRFTHKTDAKTGNHRRYIGILQDDLVDHFQHVSDEGISAVELASIVALALQGLFQQLQTKGVL